LKHQISEDAINKKLYVEILFQINQLRCCSW